MKPLNGIRLVEYDELLSALEESVKLQSHYAELLNMYDGGQRMIFADSIEWIIRLRKTSLAREEQ